MARVRQIFEMAYAPGAEVERFVGQAKTNRLQKKKKKGTEEWPYWLSPPGVKMGGGGNHLLLYI